ncbi:MAG: hypothetical protein J6S93_01170, partial [Paludibacteraceae bacterium]|nr:hypothetical protein [Paludibacteraceae bacterium]
MGSGQLTVKYVAKNAVRIQYAEGEADSSLPDWLYVRHDELKTSDVKVDVDAKRRLVTVKDRSGRIVFTATAHQLQAATV